MKIIKNLPDKFQILHKSLQIYFNQNLKEEEIQCSEARYFLLLSKENLTQAELAHNLRQDKARINRVVTNLLAKEYIEYDENSSIKNKKIKLTEKGLIYAEKCKVIFEKYIKNLTYGIDKKELEQTSFVLNQLIENACKMQESLEE